jgi:hypothetical protein
VGWWWYLELHRREDMGALGYGLFGVVLGAFIAALYAGLRGLLAGSLMVKPQTYVIGRYARLFGLLYLIVAGIGAGALWTIYSGVQAGTFPASMLLIVAAMDVVAILGVVFAAQIIGLKYVEK